MEREDAMDLQFDDEVEFEELEAFDDQAELELLAARVAAARDAGV